MVGVLGLAALLVTRAGDATGEPVATNGLRPTTIAIGALDIHSDVQPVDAPDRVLAIPPEPWVVGWWKDGAGVGSSAGTTVLVAHLDSRQYGTGPFNRAKDLHPGDAMSLTDASSSTHQYVVSAVQTYLKTALPYDQLFAQTGPPRVVLVTCGGSFHADTGWDSNVVVTFTPA